MTRTFRSTRTFSPSHSLLGRFIRYVIGDRLRGEALFILTITTLLMGVLIAHYLGWALLQPAMDASNPETWELRFWFAQIGSVLVLGLLGGLGWRPSVEATIDTDAGTLHLSQGTASAHVELADIEDVSIVSARLYHLHYRHYANTTPFIGEMTDEIIIIRSADGPLAVALGDEDAGDLVELVRPQEEMVMESQAAS